MHRPKNAHDARTLMPISGQVEPTSSAWAVGKIPQKYGNNSQNIFRRALLAALNLKFRRDSAIDAVILPLLTFGSEATAAH